MKIQGESRPEGSRSQHGDPEAVVGLACLRKSKKVIMTGAERGRESGEDTVGEERRGQGTGFCSLWQGVSALFGV